MMAEVTSEAATYTNPVYEHSFPDPFVLKHRGEYFAYCTGFADDGRVFGVLRSADLVRWTRASGAMRPLADAHPHYWAPEVTYNNGKFYLYYSVGNETLMEIRVAIANSPDGDFIDSGMRLTREDFAIDPHIVRDSVGHWYMFYAADFLDHSHIGTGTVVDRMLDPFTLEGNPRPVTRARYDWQVYDPERKEKGGVRWHTVEGPFVLKRKGVYYQMFSGGNWKNETYGVSFAVSDTVEPDGEWVQFSDGEKTLPVLRTIPERILGPGHNSVVRGPNNRELYCVYHRWSDAGRVLAIDRMDFAGGERLFINGPTDTPQPYPFPVQRLAGIGGIEDHWQLVAGEWNADGPMLVSTGSGLNEICCDTGPGADLHYEINFRTAAKAGSIGVCLKSAEIDVFNFSIDVELLTAWAEWPGSGGNRSIALPSGFDPTAAHELVLDIELETVCVALDGGDVSVSATLPAKPTGLTLYSKEVGAEFGPIDLTPGFEELFQTEEILKRGWDHYANRGTLTLVGGLLIMEGKGADNAILTRNVELGNYELCINLRVAENTGSSAALTFGCGNMFTLTPNPQPVLDSEGRVLALPIAYDPHSFSQFRIVSFRGRADIYLDSVLMGSVPAKDGEHIRISVQDTRAEVDMIRYTMI